MKSLTYKKINAFSCGSSSGNPAACIYLENGQMLTDNDMQNIARDHDGFVSEVVYCTPEGENTFSLRYYSSKCEVEFCGHGTIACMYYLIKNISALCKQPEVFICTPKGRLTVYNELQTLDAVFVSAPEPEFLTTDVNADMAADALGISSGAISGEHPIALVNAGLNTLLVQIATLRAELSIYPNEQALKKFCFDHGIDIILAYTTDVSDRKNFIRTRVFAPKFGYLEDRATGSGNSALGYYMLENNLWDGQPVMIEQNAEAYVYNIVHLKTVNKKVLFGGGATVQIEGQYYY